MIGFIHIFDVNFIDLRIVCILLLSNIIIYHVYDLDTTL